MEKLLLRIDNENLELRLNQTIRELVQMKEIESDTNFQLQGAIRELDRLQDVAQASSREIDDLSVSDAQMRYFTQQLISDLMCSKSSYL